MFEKFAEDVTRRYQEKLATLKKEAASNLRSDLVLGRLSDTAKNTLMSTPRYSRTNPGQILTDIRSQLRGRGNDMGALTQELKNRGIPYKVRGNGLSTKDIELDFSKAHAILDNPKYHMNNPSQILADIKSSLRGRGNNVEALTSELTKRGIPYKVRGKGFSPKDIELDLSKGHDILNTPYLPSNYSESFINNNVNRRFGKAVNNAYRAGYYDIKTVEEYSNPYVDAFRPYAGKKKNKPIHIAIPAKEVKGKNELQFNQVNASPILHETDEFKRSIQKDKHYDKVLKNIQNSPLRTTGEYPGVMVPSGRDRYGDDIVPLNMFGDAEEYSRSPYNTAGQNRHVSATILMNELMNQHALQVGTKPEPGSIWDTFSYRKQGPDNPVNRMTGIDLTSREQPFVPRNIARNKKEYLKRIRAVSKAEDALQSEYLRKQKLFGERSGDDPFSPIYKMIDNQVREILEKKEDLFKAFPQNIRFNSIGDFDQYLQKNPVAKQYIDNNHKDLSRWRSELPDNIDEWLRNLPIDKKLTLDESLREADAQSLLEAANDIFERDYNTLNWNYRSSSDIFSNFFKRVDNRRDRYRQRIAGDSQQNMDFLVNYLRSKGIPV